MTKELIAEALRWANGHPNRRSGELMRELADALEARQPSEDGKYIFRLIETIKQTGGSVEIHGVKIMPCDEFGRTAAVPDAATEAKQPEGWRTEDRQESKQEAERRWSRPVMREAEQRYQSGCINGFILGAEWQKARETFISYKVIADEARAERDAALAVIERIREAVSGHPECDRYEEGDVISCGWKSAYASVVAALDGAPEPESRWEYRGRLSGADPGEQSSSHPASTGT